MLALLSLPVCSASLYSQDKSDKDSVKLRAELVQIDVLVTDQSKKIVRGLKREDFELLDNGKPQPITNFVFEESKPGSVEPASTDSRAPAPAIPRAMVAGELKRVLAFIVDTLHMKPENVYSTRKMLEDFVDKRLEPGDLVLILPTAGGSGLLQQFTSDRRLLKQAINRLHPVYFTREITPYRTLDARNESLGGRRQPLFNRVGGGLSMPDVGTTNTSGNIDPLEMADVRTTLSMLDSMIKAMGKVPGRKLGVLVSEGFRLHATDTQSDLQQTIALAARSNVVFYSIDPRGLDPLILSADQSIVSEDGKTLTQTIADRLDQNRDDYRQSQESLSTIALETGGTFYHNNNDIKRGLDNLLEENAAYYMLGFQPEGRAWDGKFHKIKVVVRNHPDLVVTYRKGYLAKNEKPVPPLSANPEVAEALDAISSPFAHRDIDLRLTPLYLFNAQGEAKLTGLLHIDVSKLHFKQVNGNYQTLLEQVGYIYDLNGRAVDQFANQLALDLKPETYQTVLKRGLVATRQLSLPPGLYQMKLFVRETETRLIGTANDFFAIPNLKSGNLTMSSIFMHGGTLKDGKVVPTTGEGDTVSQRHFHKGGIFTYEVVIYNVNADEKTSQPQLEMRARVLRGGQVVFKGEFKPVAAGPDYKAPSPIVASRSFQLGNLAPDEYTLEVTVVDRSRKKDAMIRQETDFTIE
jgi:VWFA-related protein